VLEQSTKTEQQHNHNFFFSLEIRTYSTKISRLHEIFSLHHPKLTMPGLTSASGVLGFLSDEEPELKVFALQTLNDDIDTLWTEVAGSIGQM